MYAKFGQNEKPYTTLISILRNWHYMGAASLRCSGPFLDKPCHNLMISASVSPRAIFTICSNNYVAMARILLDSARRHHPEASIYLCLADKQFPDLDFYPGEGVEIVLAQDLGIPDFKAFSFRYDIMEFNTAIKPFMIRHLLQKGHANVVYFDPDIEIFAPVDHVFSLLESGASFVLTPHLTQPAERDAFPDDIGIMRAGIYNLGFIAVGAGDEAEGVLRWWSRRLLYQCVNEPDSGIFVDQKFIDLVPGFAENARVLRHTAYNVAYWNLFQRELTGGDGHWKIDGQPLRFFHFSGMSPFDTSRLSKYSQAFRGAEISDSLKSLLSHYANQALANGYGRVPDAAYAYGRFASGTYIPVQVRKMFRDRHLAWVGDPFESYEDFLHLPHSAVFGSPLAPVTNLMHYLHETEPWLNQTFSPPSEGNGTHLRNWYIKHAYALLKDRRLVEPVAIQAAGSGGALARKPPAKRSAEESDVCVIGYLRLALGVGEAGRQILKGLLPLKNHVHGVPISVNSKSQTCDASLEANLRDSSNAPIEIFNVNADQLPHVIEHLGPRLRSDAYRIVMPFWELEEFPEPWLAAFDLVDEVWAPTRFIQSMLARRLNKPVVHMPLPLSFDVPASVDRAKFGLPEDAFLFFFAFDFLSYVERKNPMGLINAYKKAFDSTERGNITVVIKALNAEVVGEHGHAMRDLLRADPEIILIEKTLSREDTLELISSCDAVVSLHRSEGLGLLVAEAMVLGKPVIATDYSATTELMSAATGWPVDFKMVEVEPHQYVFPEGQIWAQPDEKHAAWQMRQVVFNRAEAQTRVDAARDFIAEKFGKEACARALAQRLSEIEGRT
jgi:glycosyltransferase involved in cell wall biosynthesis